MEGAGERVLRVDLTALAVRVEPLPPWSAREFVGPRGIAAACLLPALNPSADPLGPDNKLAFAAGRCADLRLPGCSRLVVAGLSPATGLYGEAAAGGPWAAALRRAGFAAILVEGRAPRPIYLEVGRGTAELCDAARLWGLTTTEAEAALKAEPAAATDQVVVIGPAGENGLPFACILHGGQNVAGRAGLGAAMGAKGLKAVVVRQRGGSCGDEPCGCHGCPQPCRPPAVGSRTRRAFADLGLQDPDTMQEANRLCNAYGLDTLATAAALQGWVERTGQGTCGSVLRLIPLLAQGQLPCPAAAAAGRSRRPRADPASPQQATAALGVCRYLLTPAGPLQVHEVLGSLEAATGLRISEADLLWEEACVAEAISAFNRAAACRREAVV